MQKRPARRPPMRTTSLTLLVGTFLLLAHSSARADNRDCWNEADFGREVHAYRGADAGGYGTQTKNARAHTVIKWQILSAIIAQAGAGNFFNAHPVYYIEPFA